MNYLNFINSKSLKKQILKFLLFFILSIIIAFSPFLTTMGYAASDVTVGLVVSEIVASVSGSIFTSFLVSATGVGASIVAAPTIAAFIVLLCCIGCGIALSILVQQLLNPDFLNALGQSFFRVLYDSFDYAKMKFTCSYVVFTDLVLKLKSVLGFDTPINESKLEFEYLIMDSSFNYTSYIKNPDNFLGFTGNYLNADYMNYNIYKNKKNNTVLSLNHFWNNGLLEFTFYNGVEPVYLSAYGVDRYYLDDVIGLSIPFIDEENKKLFFATSECVWATVTDSKGNKTLDISNSVLKGGFSNISHKTLGKSLFSNYELFYTSKNCYFIDKENVKQYVYLVNSSDELFIPSTFENILYYLLYSNCSLIYGPTSVQTALEAAENNYSSTGNLSTSISSGSYTTKKKTSYTVDEETKKSISYSSSNDLTKNLVNSNTVAKSGTVSISAKDTTLDKVDSNTNVSSSVAITDVVADDVVATDTSTSTDISVSVPAEVSWNTGLNTLKISISGLTNYFPFCIPSYLKKQLTILVDDPKNPIFVIPFHIDSIDFDDQVVIDLTKFEKLTKYTDPLLLAALTVGLCFATKKLLF